LWFLAPRQEGKQKKKATSPRREAARETLGAKVHPGSPASNVVKREKGRTARTELRKTNETTFLTGGKTKEGPEKGAFWEEWEARKE